jgi:LmbE family N-acetylglucosaminyl deacetylase
MAAFLKAFDEAAKRWLFCFTHPDDEIAIAAWMRRLVKSGADVWAGWSVSDSVREGEARKAMAHLGVSDSNLFFHAMQDKGACDRLAELASLWKESLAAVQPDRIVVCAYECGHIDHDSTNFAVTKANSGVPQFEFPLYHTYLTRTPIINRFADTEGEEVLALSEEEWALKKTVSRMYPSQNIAGLLVWYTLWGWFRGRPPSLCRTERMRRQTHFDFTTPNLPKALAEKVKASHTWKRWEKAIDRSGL